MINNRKNEIQTHFDLLNFINTNKKYSSRWELQKTHNTFIQDILDKTSKKIQGAELSEALPRFDLCESKSKITYIS